MTSTYREVVTSPAWIHAVTAGLFLILLAVFAGLRGPVQAEAEEVAWLWDACWIPSLLTFPVLFVLFGRLEVRVEGDALWLRFGFLSGPVRQVPLVRIERAEPVRYAPIREFGGWGIRRGHFRGVPTAVYSLRGDTGVLLTLDAPIRAAWLTTRQLLIGSGDPEALARHLRARASDPG